ncbi:MAG: sugar phosphate isomerase/epimerase [Hyphomicrobiales bacterium]|nr:sugar phosphate isomerase/epimerase [Hyphomicrobiales bacterium]
MNWSFQLYSARDFQPWDGILEMVSEAGYSEVEGFDGVYGDPRSFRKKMEANGLSMPTGHFGIDMLEGDFARAAEIAGTLGVANIICPFLMPAQRPKDIAGWRAFGGRLAKIGEAAKKAGFEFGWHNHDYEFGHDYAFGKLPDGSVPMTAILEAAPAIGWEIDVAWVLRSGADPLGWIDRYGKRIAAVHVKDLAPAGENTKEDGWADVGHGTIDWKAMMKALREKTPAKIFVMEHDNPSDIGRFARRSIETANRL